MKLMFRNRAEVNGVEPVANTSKRRRLLAIVFTVVLALGLIVGGVYWFAQLQKKPAVDIGTGQRVSARVEVMTEAQRQQVANVSILDPVKEMDWAYAKALALSALSKHQESVEVYASIEATGKAPYYVLVDYALAASRAGDFTRAENVMSEAIKKMEADNSLSPAGKEKAKRQLTSKIEGFKESAR